MDTTQLITPAPKRLNLELDLIADFACPWSYLGKRSLERALGNLHGFPTPALRWHGFRAQTEEKPEAIAAAPQSWREHIAARLPAGISVDFAHKSLAEAGESLGIHFDFSKLGQLPDTREAHRLVALAAKEDKQSEVADGIFRAFFEEGRDITDHETLWKIGAPFSVQPMSTRVAGTLVDRDWQAGQRRGVEGSPQFFVGERTWFCPSLIINHDDGRFTIRRDDGALGEFYEAIFGDATAS